MGQQRLLEPRGSHMCYLDLFMRVEGEGLGTSFFFFGMPAVSAARRAGRTRKTNTSPIDHFDGTQTYQS